MDKVDAIARRARDQDTTLSVNVAASLKRKQCFERILSSEGVPVNPDLPLLESREDLGSRSKEEVAVRALCVLTTAIKAERADQAMVLRVIR
ncbi:MAG: DUF4272 domain-containing protein [Burkholderiales bacterium]|nr:DUF4272 domain-containing protein [Burkholderiales bacterium]